MRVRVPGVVGLAVIGSLAAFLTLEAKDAGRAATPRVEAPRFEVDPSWPTIPNGWVLGQVSSAAVDEQDHIWIIQRPRTLRADQKGKEAPPVMEFDAAGHYLQGWGGPGAGYEWPGTEHSVFVDHKGFVWVNGSGNNDDQILKFTKAGKFVLQIGHSGQSKGNADTQNVNKPADVFVYPKTNEAFVADGYGNRRVLVLDAATGSYKRHWGAYGNRPSDEKLPAYDPARPLSPQFGNPVHCARLSKDGLVYVCDRANDRIQVFEKSGKFLREFRIEPQTLQNGSVWDLVLSEDAAQKYLFMADGANGQVLTLERATGRVLGGFGRNGRMAGEFKWVHNIAIDSRGNLYTSEVGTGRRAQKFARRD
jgi:hypothetical protein